MTKLLDQSCKDIRKTQSDGWSSEDEDDDVFDTSQQEMTSPHTGFHVFVQPPQCQSVSIGASNPQPSSCFCFLRPTYRIRGGTGQFGSHQSRQDQPVFRLQGQSSHPDSAASAGPAGTGQRVHGSYFFFYYDLSTRTCQINTSTEIYREEKEEKEVETQSLDTEAVNRHAATAML